MAAPSPTPIPGTTAPTAAPPAPPITAPRPAPRSVGSLVSQAATAMVAGNKIAHRALFIKHLSHAVFTTVSLTSAQRESSIHRSRADLSFQSLFYPHYYTLFYLCRRNAGQNPDCAWHIV